MFEAWILDAHDDDGVLQQDSATKLCLLSEWMLLALLNFDDRDCCCDDDNDDSLSEMMYWLWFQSLKLCAPQHLS